MAPKARPRARRLLGEIVAVARFEKPAGGDWVIIRGNAELTPRNDGHHYVIFDDQDFEEQCRIAIDAMAAAARCADEGSLLVSAAPALADRVRALRGDERLPNAGEQQPRTAGGCSR